MPLTIDNIQRQYDRVKRSARRALCAKDYNGAMKWLSTSADIAYSFNWIYSDPESEELLKQISKALFGVKSLKPRTDRVVFYDAFGWDSRGLAQQYIRAFRELGTEFLYIFENHNSNYSQAILSDLGQCGDRVEVFALDKRKSTVEQCRMLADKIAQYSPSRAFLHIGPGSTKALCTFAAFPDIVKYNINLTDHAFWLGVGCVDYNIEFRDYGQTVSLEKRGFTERQLLQLPYYPIQNAVPFQGWPGVCGTETVKIFSGGSFYKIYPEQGRFFHFAKRILEDNPMAVIYFAGGGNAEHINRFITENHFQTRFILIGNRRDIDAVFENCDIYLGTYPIAGGLMSQYAAIHRKPILAYTTPELPANDIEGIICHNRYEQVTFYCEAEFFDYAKKLCHDESFRRSEGARLEGCTITPAQFNSGLQALLTQNQSYKPYTHIRIDYQKWVDLYLELDNCFLKKYSRRFLRYRLMAALAWPAASLKSICSLFKHTPKL